MNETDYRIKFRKGDVEIEIQGDRNWVEHKFEELIDKEVAIVSGETPRAEGMPKTLVEFLGMKGNLTKHTDICVVFAYWLFKVENMESFNVKDLNTCYDRTRTVKSSNINQVANDNISRKYFAEAPEKKDGSKAWVITRPGEEYVEQLK